MPNPERLKIIYQAPEAAEAPDSAGHLVGLRSRCDGSPGGFHVLKVRHAKQRADLLLYLG
jgi:hypothetical protein